MLQLLCQKYPKSNLIFVVINLRKLLSNLSSSYPIPLFSLKKSERNIKESISRIATGINVLGGNDVAKHNLGTTLKADGKSFQQAASGISNGLSMVSLVEQALFELDALASRLKEIGQQATLSTNTTEDTASLNSEATSVSDTIDSIVSSLTFNDINILGTSAKQFTIGINDAGTTATIKTTSGIAATNITGATNANTSASTTIGEIRQSLGAVAGSITSFSSYLNIAESSSAELIAHAAKLQDTDFAIETAKVAKNAILKNYSLAMVAQVNDLEESQLKILV